MEKDQRYAVAGLLMIVGALCYLSASMLASGDEDFGPETADSVAAGIVAHPGNARFQEGLWASGNVAFALVGLTMVGMPARGARAIAWPLLALQSGLHAFGSVLAATVGADAALAGRIDEFRVYFGIHTSLDVLIPLTMLAFLALAVAEARDGASRLPRWANAGGAVAFAGSLIAVAGDHVFAVPAAGALYPLFIPALIWLTALGATQVRAALAAPAPAPRATFAAQER